MSDHDMLLVTTSFASASNKREKRTVYSYRKANWDQIKSDLSSCRDTILSSVSSSNVETIWNVFKSSVLSSMKRNIPTKTLRKKLISHGCRLKLEN
ncbi:hypothetical protein DPMN_026450 [Dreissena polymorpha]|uniref:Uncharacterized protein n=1 Tax=Dreissena polymorpha TaxID=45954 RepID=A0A9D4RCL2_DREPO|nr:hypothetical protein DPMN_026450 [Dreissena polymorpha]